MADSDRTQYFKVRLGQVGDLRTLSNALSLNQQLDQRYLYVDLAPTGTVNAAAANLSFAALKLDRNVTVISATLVATANTGILNDNTNVAQFQVMYANANGQTLLSGTAVSAQLASNATNIFGWKPTSLTLNAANVAVASGNILGVIVQGAGGGANANIAQGTCLHIVYQET